MYAEPYGELELEDDFDGFGDFGALEVEDDLDGLGELELALDGYGQAGWRRRRWQRRRPWQRRRFRGGGRHRQRWGRRGSKKRLKRKAKFLHNRSQRIRKRIERAEESGNEELANRLRQRLSRVTKRRMKMLVRSAGRGGRRGKAAQHIMDVGRERRERREEGEGLRDVAEATDGFGFYADDYDGYWEDVQGMIPAKGPMRTGLFAVAGAGLAHVLTKGSKKKKYKAALFGAGAAALLALFMDGKAA